ncbi:MAG: polysaccharide pyruvyl transferase family protein [Caldilineaceae bacterium]|nr:polysaccharide pyruvyl transferase family protein [Caldilineaceae bacterium]
MKILIINLHSSRNAGDDVLLRVTLDQLYRHFPGAAITLAMNDPASYGGAETTMDSFTAWFKPMREGRSAWRWGAVLAAPLLLLGAVISGLLRRELPFSSPRQKLLRAYREADFVVSCPGNFLYSSGLLGVPFLLTLFTIWYALFLGKPLYAMPQTVGPVGRRHEAWLLGKLLSRYRLLFLRDHISAERGAALGLALGEAAVIPDIAFDFPSRGREAGRKFLADAGVDGEDDSPLLGVTVIDWGAQNRLFTTQADFEVAVAGAVDNFLRECNGRVVLFAQVHGPTEAEDDRIPAARVAARLSGWGEQVVLAPPVHPDILKAAYGEMDIFLGTRLHSCIFALGEGVPVVSIAYQYKSRGLFRLLAMEAQVVDIEDVSTANLSALLMGTWQERVGIRQQLAEQLPRLRQQIQSVGQRIYDDQQRQRRP